MSMKLYLSASYYRKDEIQRYAKSLRDAGFEIGSSWQDSNVTPEKEESMSKKEKAEFAVQDLIELLACDGVLHFTDGIPSRGGRTFELGFYVAAKNKNPVAIIGPAENAFHELPWLFRFDNLPGMEIMAAKLLLEAWQGNADP
jgi:nucleoside 2-deoxyribosyltransferase